MSTVRDELSPRRREILAAATTVLAQQGNRGLTHRAVDREAGLLRGQLVGLLPHARGAARRARRLRGRPARRRRRRARRATRRPARVTTSARSPRSPGCSRAGSAQPDLLAARLELTVAATRDPALAERFRVWRDDLVEMVDERAAPAPARTAARPRRPWSPPSTACCSPRSLLPARRRKAFVGESVEQLLAGLGPHPRPRLSAAGGLVCGRPSDPRVTGVRHARGSDRFCSPLPHRPRQQGLAEGLPARRPDGARRPGRAGQDPRPRPRRDRGPPPRLRPARRRVRQQHGARRHHAARPRGPGRDGHPLLLLVGADHPDGLPRDQGRRGRHLRLGRRRDRVALRQGHLRPHPRHPQPALRGGRRPHRRVRRRAARTGTTRARTASCPTSTSRWARPPRTSPACAASTARSSTSSPSARRTSPRRPSPTASGSGRSPPSRRPTARS